MLPINLIFGDSEERMDTPIKGMSIMAKLDMYDKPSLLASTKILSAFIYYFDNSVSNLDDAKMTLSDKISELGRIDGAAIWSFDGGEFRLANIEDDIYYLIMSYEEEK